MAKLSVIIPGRKEEWLARTVADVLAHAEADTEVIAVIDGEAAGPEPEPHPRLKVLRLPASIGQRAATNLGVKESRAEYVMKLDAHCGVEQGFDVKLITALAGQPKNVLVPAQKNFMVFWWKCATCSKHTYMGPYPEKCEAMDERSTGLLPHHRCDGKQFERVMVWKPRPGTTTTFWIFDNELHFQYRGASKSKIVTEGELSETMSMLGACFTMSRERYWQIGGLDEAHGSWGQMGTEIACKTWLSGGRLLVHHGTWFAHMFRTRQSEGFGFPYHNPGSLRLFAQDYSKRMWLNDAWPGQVYPLAWLVNRFKPLIGGAHTLEDGTVREYHNWHSPGGAHALKHIRESERKFYQTHPNLSRQPKPEAVAA